MSDTTDKSTISFPNTKPNGPNFSGINLPPEVSQQIALTNLKGDQSVNLPGQVNSPDTLSWQSSNIMRSPMVSLNDSSATLGRKVLYIDPKIASDKLREFSAGTSIGLLSPSYAHSPSRSTPPLGSVLQTPPDLTPTRVTENSYIPRTFVNDLSQGSLAPARSPAISKSINEFIQSLPTVTPSLITSPPASAPIPIPIPTPTPTPAPIVPPQVTSPKSSAPLPNQEFISEEDAKANHEKRIQDAKDRADYRVKFSILREAYPQMKIPEPNEDETIDEVKAAYKQYVKRIHVESSVEQNKIYLLILWLIIDVVGTRFFRLPFHGRYVKSQFKYMQKYQILLIELGERSYVDGSGEGWPVEFRLLAMAVFHGVIFALVQILASKLGGGSANNDKMADEFRDVIDNFLTQNKGADVLRRAEQATSDNPEPLSATQNATPPLGDLGSMIGNFMPMIMNMFGGAGGAGGGNEGGQSQASQPQLRKPTTFGARHRKGQTANTENTG